MGDDMKKWEVILISGLALVFVGALLTLLGKDILSLILMVVGIGVAWWGRNVYKNSGQADQSTQPLTPEKRKRIFLATVLGCGVGCLIVPLLTHHQRPLLIQCIVIDFSACLFFITVAICYLGVFKRK